MRSSFCRDYGCVHDCFFSLSLSSVHGFTQARYDVIEEGRLRIEFKANVKGQSNSQMLEKRKLLAGEITPQPLSARTLKYFFSL